MWWRGDTLCAPPADGLLPGITRKILFELAEADGVPTCRSVQAFPTELAGCEAWVVNALHGIRHGTGWIGASAMPAAAMRAEQWNECLDQLAKPMRAR